MITKQSNNQKTLIQFLIERFLRVMPEDDFEIEFIPFDNTNLYGYPSEFDDELSEDFYNCVDLDGETEYTSY